MRASEHQRAKSKMLRMILNNIVSAAAAARAGGGGGVVGARCSNYLFFDPRSRPPVAVLKRRCLVVRGLVCLVYAIIHFGAEWREWRECGRSISSLFAIYFFCAFLSL